MAIPLSDNILTDAPKPSDARYGPWASVAEACASVPVSRRYLGLTVGILVSGVAQDYAWAIDLTNGNLLPKASGANPGTPGGGAASLSLAAAQALPPAVDPGTRYAIAGAWNGQAGHTVYVDGLNPTTYAPTGWALDADGAYRKVVVNVAAGTFDTAPLRDLQLFQASEVDEATGQVTLWLGEAATQDAVIEEILL